MQIDLSEVVRMATAGALVAAGAVPVGLVAHALRPRGEPLLPRWKPFPVPWSGFEVAVTFLAVVAVIPITTLQVLDSGGFFQFVYGDGFPPLSAKDVPADQKAEASTLRGLWAGLFALPIVLGALALVRYSLHARWRPAANGSVPNKVALAVAAWLLVTPAVLLLNAVVNAVAVALGAPPEAHSLTKLGQRPLLDQALLVLGACVIAPVSEEVLFRGIILWWSTGRIRFPGLGVTPVTGMRPWLVLLVAGLFSAAAAAADEKWQPVAFAAVLVVGLAVLYRVTRTGARRARAVYATAAFFALVHPTWPNPIALFALGLALGYLAARTNGLLVPVLVHALFNAVSVVYVLRG
ncbi:CPBP family intramembrane metalloprotease [Gemmata sp. JC673]|uniref:CPBP family intramembrane metalloprotease n=1 Tax=Gemmata algarum TaxID=2975278 RepID=A0ABU5F099_9BACT|nr:CPBP family intramembrane glutamic endopeptidase [Gemmata algarum]MDY3560980.1 CPBP family intramembrane metalloprotease [Gemmata algarum]